MTVASDDGGTGIFAYHLHINEGANGTPMHEITAYDGQAATYTISAGDVVGTHTMTLGKIYTIKYVAENSVGLSLDSDQLYVALARKPNKPAQLTFDQERSTR